MPDTDKHTLTGSTPNIPPAERLPGRVLAAPSWVMPGTVAENCAFLASVVDEVGLLFMETSACLAYDKRDLPNSLADLPLTYHVHLPLDLPMQEPEQAADICARLLDKTAHLPSAAAPAKSAVRENASGKAVSEKPKTAGPAPPAIRAVLHPPVHDPADSGLAARLLDSFAESWLNRSGNPSQFLLENTRGNDLTHLGGPVLQYGFSLCLDMGHALAYGQEKLLRRQSLLQHVDMLHVNAPGRGSRAGAHLSLTSLDESSRRQAERMCLSIPGHAVVMMEFFSWRLIAESLPMLRSWLGKG